MRRRARAIVLVGLALSVAGCGIGARQQPVTVPQASAGPSATVSAAVEQTRGAIAGVLSARSLQLTNPQTPYRPAETVRLAAAPRAVYQVLFPNDPVHGYIVVYEFRDPGAAVDAGNDEAGYLGTGAGKVQFPIDARFTLRQVGTTLIFYTWAPSTASDERAAQVADALSTLGTGFAPPR